MKLAKLSLAAIMTVGAISAANATSLEEAIKGVDLAGYARYRFEDGNNKDHTNGYKLELAFTTPVVEDVKLYTRFDAAGAANNDGSAGNSDAALTFNRVYLTYTPTKELTVLAGKQGIGAGLDDMSGTGVKVLYTLPVGVTFLAAYFDNLNYSIDTNGDDVKDTVAYDNAYAAAVIYSSKTLGAKFLYVKGEGTNAFNAFLTEDSSKATHMLAEVSGGVEMIMAKLQYATAKRSWDDNKAKTIRLGLTGKVKNFGYKAGFVKNDKSNGNVTLDGADQGDTDLITAGWKTKFNETYAQYFYVGANATFGKVGVGLDYVSVKDKLSQSEYNDLSPAEQALVSVGDRENQKNEIAVNASYAMTKKLSTVVKYSTMKGVDGGDKRNNFRFEAKYSF